MTTLPHILRMTLATLLGVVAVLIYPPAWVLPFVAMRRK